MNIKFPNLNIEEKIENKFEVNLPNPSDNEPFIGVIDSGINLKGDFGKYYDYESHLESGHTTDIEHGNMVSSLIIANDEINSDNKDNLGNFKVKHFEILGKNPITGEVTCSYRHILSKVRELVENNQKIKIWNLSFGIERNYLNENISSFGSMLDYLVEKYKVIFIIASGNSRIEKGVNSLNIPGDSFNSLTVGSIKGTKRKIKEASAYSSIGIVSNYIKPEVAHYGGPLNKNGKNKLKVVGKHSIVIPNELESDLLIQGTSFSTPRVVRLAAHYFLNGYNPLEIKAKIISIAKKQNRAKDKASKYGYLEFDEPENDFDFKFSGQIYDNNPHFIEEVILNNVDKVKITIALNANYNYLLGNEYSISDIEIKLVKLKKDWRNIPVTRRGTTKLCDTPDYYEVSKRCDKKADTSLNTFHKWAETNKRSIDNKYFTSKKIEYDLTNEKNQLNKDEYYAIKIKRLDLIKYTELNKTPLDYSVIIEFEGENLNKEEFIIKNKELLVEVEIEKEVELEQELEI